MLENSVDTIDRRQTSEDFGLGAKERDRNSPSRVDCDDIERVVPCRCERVESSWSVVKRVCSPEKSIEVKSSVDPVSAKLTQKKGQAHLTQE